MSSDPKTTPAWILAEDKWEMECSVCGRPSGYYYCSNECVEVLRVQCELQRMVKTP